MNRILDLGSGNSSKNDIKIIRKMIDAISEVDPERKWTLKWQLFQEAPPNVPLQQKMFHFAYYYAESLGYKTTASVFDIESLEYLLRYDIPFVKIANRPDLYWLIGEVPRKIPVVVSADFSFNMTSIDKWKEIRNENILFCVSEYPAKKEVYENFTENQLKRGISDHTENFSLFLKYKPQIYECHFCLTHDDPGNPDAGSFSRTPEQIKEVYKEL